MKHNKKKLLSGLEHLCLKKTRHLKVYLLELKEGLVVNASMANFLSAHLSLVNH